MPLTVKDIFPSTDDLLLGLVINGEEVFGESALESFSPSDTSRVVGRVTEATSSDVKAAVTAASAAKRSWAAVPPHERIELFAKIADELDAHADRLATLVAMENGSVRAIVRRELVGASHAFRSVANYLVEKLRPQEYPAGPHGEFVRVERKPYGVVACIVPWNAPLILTANKIAPALAAGNTIVLKPSPHASLGVSIIGRIAASILPSGVVNVINGGGEVGSELVGHPAVRKISFTGGGKIAQHIMRQASERLQDVHFELGGNDPAIVLDDADLATTCDRLAESAFRRAGQVCFAVKRVYVPHSILEEFQRRLVERVDEIKIGDALDERATMGPVNNAAQFSQVKDLLSRTINQGREVHLLGTKLEPEKWEAGHYLQPAVVVDAQQDDEIVQSEQFGPVLPIIGYDSEEQAIAWANDTEYGLCSSVWSTSAERALSVASQIEAGMTIVNSHIFSPTGTQEIPFGGWKQSGIGWEASHYGIDEYLQFHSVDVQTTPSVGAVNE